MSTLIAANWKMHLTPTQAQKLVKRLQERIAPKRGTEVVLCPPFVDLHVVREAMERGHFKLGAQNCHQLDEGAVTGEVSAAMLRGLVDYVILGHSERRAQFGEDDNLIAQKVAAAVRNGLRPILCVGENASQRHHGLARNVVTGQVVAGLALLTADEVAQVTVAYEPIWAIGTDATATPGQIEPMVQAIRTTIEELYSEGGATRTRIIYGAGTDPEFVTAILAIPGVDGFLVGHESLNYEKFAQIVEKAQKSATMGE